MPDGLSGLSAGIDGLVDPLVGSSDPVDSGSVLDEASASEDGGSEPALVSDPLALTSPPDVEGEESDPVSAEDGSDGSEGVSAPDSMAAPLSDENSDGSSDLVLAAASAPEMQMSSMEGMESGDHGDHSHDAGDHAGHHASILGLVDPGVATHVALASGGWFDPATWGGEVPGAGARVVIPDGVDVVYNGSSAAEITTIRVDGALRFPSAVDTALSVDTIVVTADGSFEIGSAAEPVTAEAVITFVSTDTQDDPGQVGLGLVSLPGAHVGIHGADVTGRVVVEGDQLAGDGQLEIQGGVPGDWAVGDVIVLAGTSYDKAGDNDLNERFHDEVLEITGIGPDGVSFINRDTGESVLRFDHVTPEGFDFDIHAINLSRAITFTSADGTDTAVAERGHIMVMDHDSVVSNAALVGLGRTDKSVPLDPLPTTFEIDGVNTSIDGTGTNVPGRYALHVHRAFDHGDDGGAVQFLGNAVWDTPGWGIVLHGSRGHVDDNVVFDTVGAAIVTEDGDEVGYFTGNTVIKVASGTNSSDFPGDIVRLKTAEGLPIDYGFHGNGFWFDTGFSVREATGNVSASTAHAGIFIYGLNDGETNLDVDPATAPTETLKYVKDGIIDPFHVPVGLISDNKIYNAQYGMFLAGITRDDILSNSGSQDHLDRSVISDSEIWAVSNSGIFTAYAQGFEFHNMVIAGNLENPNNREDGRGHDAGIMIGKSNHNVIIDGVRIEGFHTGIKVSQGGTQGYHDVDPIDLVQISNVNLANNIQNFTPSLGRTGQRANLHPGRMDEPPFNPYAQLTGSFNVDASASNFYPITDVSITQIGTNAFFLDASGSYDPDYQQDTQIADRETIENSIAFYQWDFDGDGVADAFGREVAVHFKGSDAHEVSLTLTDAQGAQTTTSIQLTPGSGTSRNALDDGGFDRAGTIYREVNHIGNARIETGPEAHAWGTRYFNNGDFTSWQQVNGHAQVNGRQFGAKILDQLVANRGEHRGADRFGFDVKYSDQDGNADSLVAEVWGINGIPEIATFSAAPPQAIFSQEPFTADILYSSGNLLAAGDFDWQRIEADVDFGQGYDYLYVRFVADDVNADLGDILAIDNVTLGGTEFGANSEAEPPENLAPFIAEPVSFDVQENITAPVATLFGLDPEGEEITWSIVGGPDAAAFTIGSNTGAISFVNAPDFENPGDADGGNDYVFTVQASDGVVSTQAEVLVTVLNEIEGVNTPPKITSPLDTTPEGEARLWIDLSSQGELTTILAQDFDNDSLQFRLFGEDAALFDLDPVTGVLSLPQSVPGITGSFDTDWIYELTVQVIDENGGTDIQDVILPLVTSA